MTNHFYISDKFNRINILFLFLLLWVYKIFGRAFLPIQYYRVIDIIIIVPILLLIILLVFKLFFSVCDQQELEKRIKELKRYSHDYDEIETNRRINELEVASSKLSSSKVLFCIRNNITDISNEEIFMKTLPIIVSTPLLNLDFTFFGEFFPNLYFGLIALISLGLVSLIIWNILKRHDNNLVKIVGQHLASIIFLLFINKSNLINKFGNEIMGSFLEKDNYQSFNLIKLRNRRIDSTVTVPALIEVTNSKEYDDEPDFVHDIRSIGISRGYNVREIKIIKAYNVNGVALTFKNCYLELGNEDFCIDQFGRTWRVEVTKKKVKIR